MGRKAGGKNFGNFDTEPKQTVTEKAIAAGEISEADKARLPEIFTCIKKDFITVKDFMEISGLGYDTCAKIIREIKAISDIFRISGCVHRTDYYAYLSRKFAG